MHNSAARSEAAATALKSELVLQPPRVFPLSLLFPPRALRTLPIVALTLSLSRLSYPSHSAILLSRIVRCSSVEFRVVERRFADSIFRGFLVAAMRRERGKGKKKGRRRNIYLALGRDGLSADRTAK